MNISDYRSYLVLLIEKQLNWIFYLQVSNKLDEMSNKFFVVVVIIENILVSLSMPNRVTTSLCLF